MQLQPDNKQQFCLTVRQIAAITGAPVENVEIYWPIILKAFEREQIADRLVLIALLATLAMDDPQFTPIEEPGTDEYFSVRYGHRRDLGNVFPGDGPRFHGRGFIPILVGRTNYYVFSALTGLDLMCHPELALNPIVAAKNMAVYFKMHHIAEAARDQDWKRVRFLANGALHDFGRFFLIVTRLLMYA
jgi:hypothetical protein